MAKIEVTQAQRKKCVKCKHSGIMTNKERDIGIYVCTAQLHKYQKFRHKEAIDNYWELVLDALEKKCKKEKEQEKNMNDTYSNKKVENGTMVK